MRYILLITCLNISLLVFTQSKYIYDDIPDSLKKGVDYIVWKDIEHYKVLDRGSAIDKSFTAVCIMDQHSRYYSQIGSVYNDDSKIIKIKATIFDKFGNEVKKLKSSDIKDVSLVEGGTMYSDRRGKIAHFTHNQYPYTIEFEITRKIDGILRYPTSYFQYLPKTSIVSRSFTITIPNDMSLRYKEFNFPGKVNITNNEKSKSYSWKVKNLAAYDPVDKNPGLKEFTPVVMLAPTEFEMDGYAGNLNSWNDLGKWNWTLNKNRDELPNETILKIKELTQSLSSKKEKVKLIYEYLQNKVRYVSVQLGIGGLQPYPASYVDEKGYGDCKALTNYTYSLLKSIGIKSHYTLINAGEYKEDIIHDFPSDQFNHIILCVPQEKDTIWLECTSQQQPFNFLGSFTDDRHALLITEDGGKLVKTPKYGKDVNTQYRNVDLKLDANGDALAKVHTKFRGLQYENREGWSNESVKEQKDALKETYAISGMEINNFKFTEYKDEIPSIHEDLDLTIMRFASTSSKRMFIKMNVFNQTSYVPKNKERKIPFRLTYEFLDIDTVNFEIPEGYTIENKPKDYDLNTKFGTYSCKFEQNGNKVKFIREYSSEKGIFPAQDYKAYYEFRKKIKKADKAKLVLVKT